MGNFLNVISINRDQWRTGEKKFLLRLYSLRFCDQDYVRQVPAFLDEPNYQAVAAIHHTAACTNLVLMERYGGKETNG